MSTTEIAVAENMEDASSQAERAIALGPGVIRLPDSSYLRPQKSIIAARCLGPLAHWKVSSSFAVPALGEGEDPLLFLYVLPPEASLVGVSLNEESLLPGKLGVKATSDIPESAESPLPPDSLIAEFGDGAMPIFSLQLSPWQTSLQAGAQLEITLEYAAGLPTVDGRISLTYPLAVSQEFGCEGETSFEVLVAIEDGNELVDDPESSIPLDSTQDGEIHILSGSFESSDPELAISFRPGRTQMPVTRLRRSDEYFIFSIFPPTSIPASPQRRDIVFAVDASENLDLESYSKVRADICAALRGLDENDRFALVTFGREIDGYDGGEFCDIDQVDAACKWFESSQPKGRADVQPLLQRIQSLPSQEDRQLCIFLVAAGHVGNEPAILKSLDFDQSDRRYYTVGIGATAKQSFLRRLALLTRGRCEVASDGGCAEALERLLGQTRALLAEVTFEEQNGSIDIDADSQVPSRMTSLTPQGPVHCLGAGAPSSLRFRSKDETGVFFAGTVNAQNTDNPALAGVWAGLRVRELLDSIQLTTGAKRKALKAEASGLAAERQILTEDTVLVLETDLGIQIQYSAQPVKWSAEPKVKKGNVSNKESTAPFDWRKGLVAREGLFKGSKGGSDSGESGRYGLRSKGGSSESSGKPRLDRGTSAGHAEPEPVAEPAEVVGVGVPVTIPSGQPHVLQLQSDPLSEGCLRFEAYQNQIETFDTELALAALQGLPRDLSPSGGELPRILAQTVAHLEKRGFYSHAVSVLGLLFRDNPSPEVKKKMETLLATWSNSLPDDKLPEAIQILQLGQKVCRGSDDLASRCRPLWERWSELSQTQQAMPVVMNGASGEVPSVVPTLLTEPQLELAKLKEEQQSLSRQMAELKESLEQQMSGLPDLLKGIVEQTAAAVTALQPEVRIVEVPQAAPPAQVAPPIPVVSDPVPSPADLPLEQEPDPEPEQPVMVVFPDADPDPEPSQEVPATPEPAELVDIPLPVEDLAPAPESPALEPSVPVAEVAETLDIPMPEAEPVLPEIPEILDEPVPPPGESAEPAPVMEPAQTASVEPEPAEPSPAEPAEPPSAELEPAEPPSLSEDPVIEDPFASEPIETSPVEPAVPQEVVPLTREELTELLMANPRGEDSKAAAAVSLTEPKDRINFFRELVKADKSEPYHSLSLARAYRAADQTKVAVVHYQKYLRSEKDPQAYLELADAYDELGKANLSASARKAADAYGGT